MAKDTSENKLSSEPISIKPNAGILIGPRKYVDNAPLATLSLGSFFSLRIFFLINLHPWL